MDADHVLAVLAEVVASCRGTGDLSVVERRLALAERVVPMMAFPSSAPVALPGPAASLAGLLGRCQPDEDDWEWCRSLFAGVGFDAARLVNEAAGLVLPGLAGAYGSPVKNFLPRERYGLAAVADLPFAHIPSWCDHKPVYDARLALEERRNR